MSAWAVWKKNIVAKCHSKAESHLYLRYGEIQANARNDIERNDTVSFQAEYKLHAFQLAFECTEWEKREKKSCRTIVYSPKYMIRQVQVIYCKAYNKKKEVSPYSVCNSGANFIISHVYVCASACMRTCSRNCSIRFSNGHEKLRTFKHKPMLDACPNIWIGERQSGPRNGRKKQHSNDTWLCDMRTKRLATSQIDRNLSTQSQKYA